MAFIVLISHLIAMFIPLIHFPVDCRKFILHLFNSEPVPSHVGVRKQINIDAFISVDVNVHIVLTYKIEFFANMQHFYEIL